MTALATGRDIALLLLILEAIIIALVPLVALYLLVKYLPRLITRLRGWMRTLAGWVYRAGAIAAAAMRLVLAPVQWVAGLWAGVARGLEVWRDWRRNDAGF
ncbi:MAG: hypothetical protein ACUVX9_13225 [Anaerolineae bacterium]